MNDLLISLHANTLKITYCNKVGCAGLTAELDSSLVDGSRILDVEGFTAKVIEVSSPLIASAKKPRTLSFILEPEDVFLEFLTVKKNAGKPVSEQLEDAITSKLEAPLEDFYYSYRRIAPFLYQFVAIEKAHMDSLLAVSSLWGVPLRAITPWPLLLPKSLSGRDPAVFVVKAGSRYVVALSELNGVYFSSVYATETSPVELSALISRLCVYNRKTPIKRVYVYGFTPVGWEDFEVLSVPVLDRESHFVDPEYPLHDLVRYVFADISDLEHSQVNLLTALPLPEKVSSKLPAVAVSVFAGVALLGAFAFYKFGAISSKSANVLGNADVQESSQAVSDVSLAQGQTAQESSDSAETETVMPAKEDIHIRVENACGVNGAAGRTKTLLEDAGYDVVEIDTALNRLEVSQLLLSPELMPLKDDLLKVLGDSVPIEVIDELDTTHTDGDTDSEGAPAYNVLIRLGKNSSI